MIKLEQEASSGISGLDLTPLIDIIFIVLVFLLLTANSQLLSLPIDVPTESKSNLQTVTQEKHLTINIMPTKPLWALEGKSYIKWEEFEADFIKLYTSHPKAKIIVAADKSAPVQPLMTLLALLQRQTITNTQILMEP